ncbi:MAG: hypothetical protein AABP62_17670 [Planctomycetota bacterium]
MSIDLAEKLKDKLTDKFVVVDGSVPELKRFANWTGRVKTVNMNCRALVEFDGPVDISWYDIDPAYLTVVDAPVKRAAPAPVAKAPASAAAPAAKPAAPAGKSPLDAIRAQQAATKPAAASGAKPSPLDMIRKQQAAKAKPESTEPAPESAAAPVETVAAVEPVPAPVAPTPKPAAPTTGPDGRPLSKLDMIRMQGAAKQS